jgi:putative glutamine amidotransferase
MAAPELAAPIVVCCLNADKSASYVAALLAVGVPAAMIRTAFPGDPGAAELVANASGLVLCGGEDVDPRRYGEEPIPAAEVDVNALRDAFEWDVLSAARAARTPTFGVCRGSQLINVFMGGTLYQDLPLQRPSSVDHDEREPRDLLAHAVLPGAIEATDSLPFAALFARRGEFEVNSRHHQGVRRLAPKLVPLASAPDGLLEAYALPSSEGWWLAGVQWHPENLVEHAAHRELWQEFVRVCRETPPANPHAGSPDADSREVADA